MGIELRQIGEAALVGKAAVLAGKSQRARELEQIAIRRQEQIRSIKAQRETQQIQIQQQTNMKLLDAQLDLEKYERAKRWEIDKAEIASRVDFEREEKTRQRALDEYDATIKYVNDSDLFDERTKEALKFKAQMKLSDQNISLRDIVPERFRTKKESVLSLLGGAEDVSPVDMNIGNPLGLNIQPVDVAAIPLSAEVQQLETQNRFRVISPDGNEEIINAVEWPVKKTQGYILADIAELRERKPRETIKRFAIGKF